jgi:hypothetical protein
MSTILVTSWKLEDIQTKHDSFLYSLFTDLIEKAHPIVPIKFKTEDIPELMEKLEKIYLDFFKNSVIKYLKKYFFDYHYEYDIKDGLNVLIEEIKQEKVSFRNLKSKILYLIEKNENYKTNDDGENKFSSNTRITIEDL